MEKDFIDACKRGSVESVKRDLKRLDRWCIQPIIDEGFLYACARGHTEVVSILLKLVFDYKTLNSGFIWAACHGYTQVVKLLLTDLRIDPSCEKNEAIRHASHNGYKKTVKLLLADKESIQKVKK